MNTPNPAPSTAPNTVSVPDLAALARDKRLHRFTVLLRGNALAPDLPDGALLTVDASALAAPGDAVIAATKGGSPGCFMLNADGDLCDRAGGFVERGTFRVLGVVANTSLRTSPR